MRRQTALYAGLLSVLFVGVIAVGSLLPPGPQTESISPVPVPADAKPELSVKPALIPALMRKAAQIDPGPLPHSLRGTKAPGGWLRVEDGQLVPTPQLRELFEYYLSALGEEPLQTIVARIRAALSVLPPGPRQQALKVLGHYLDYRLALTQLGSGSQGAVGPGSDPADIAAQLARVRDLRRDTLGERVAEAFFARDEALDQYTLARLRITRDGSLTPQQKKVRLAAAEAQLPALMQQSRAATQRFESYQQSLQQLRRNGASEAQVDQLRQQTFGAEAAQKLAVLDQQRADWQRRWKDYRTALAQVEAAGLSSDEKAQQQKQLRQQYFSQSEMARVEALDSIQKPVGNSP